MYQSKSHYKVEKENTNARKKKTKENKNKLQSKTSYKVIFRPEHAGDISYVFVIKQIFESVSNLFAKQMSKTIAPTYGTVLVRISFCSAYKKIAHCRFFIDKMKNIKKLHHA